MLRQHAMLGAGAWSGKRPLSFALSTGVVILGTWFQLKFIRSIFWVTWPRNESSPGIFWVRDLEDWPCPPWGQGREAEIS
jgi:hypothetical protein